MTQTWLVCEESGRWAAALRVAFDLSMNIASRLRLIEVRNLAELATQPNGREADLVLIEVGTANLAAILEFAGRRGSQHRPFVALLKDVVERPLLTDLLWEAGAAEVVSSPRELCGLLELHHRMAAYLHLSVNKSFKHQSFADWALSMLPWQGT